jgi:large subunit ribosomal protein L4e
MKTKLLDKTGKLKKEIKLPDNFSSKIRRDILLKSFETLKSGQKRGSKPGAGAQYSASGILRHRRHKWKTTYGRGISRVPRKILSRHGSSFNWVGATIASTRGGRRAHPPKSIKNQFKKINKKELLIAFNTGFTGTGKRDCLKEKYGKSFDNVPVVFDSGILNLKTKEFISVLKKVFKGCFGKILKKKKKRAGKGKLRGRKYKSNAGVLFVIGSNEEMNRKGIDVVKVKDLEIRDLAPNGEPGRFACYTEKAIKEIGERFK